MKIIKKDLTEGQGCPKLIGTYTQIKGVITMFNSEFDALVFSDWSDTDEEQWWQQVNNDEEWIVEQMEECA